MSQTIDCPFANERVAIRCKSYEITNELRLAARTEFFKGEGKEVRLQLSAIYPFQKAFRGA
jgi:hypothetical protein